MPLIVALTTISATCSPVSFAGGEQRPAPRVRRAGRGPGAAGKRPPRRLRAGRCRWARPASRPAGRPRPRRLPAGSTRCGGGRGGPRPRTRVARSSRADLIGEGQRPETGPVGGRDTTPTLSRPAAKPVCTWASAERSSEPLSMTASRSAPTIRSPHISRDEVLPVWGEDSVAVLYARVCGRCSPGACHVSRKPATSARSSSAVRATSALASRV